MIPTLIWWSWARMAEGPLATCCLEASQSGSSGARLSQCSLSKETFDPRLVRDSPSRRRRMQSGDPDTNVERRGPPRPYAQRIDVEFLNLGATAHERRDTEKHVLEGRPIQRRRTAVPLEQRERAQ